MAGDDKKPTPPKTPALEHYVDFGEAILKREYNINESYTVTISQRVPITPEPAQPPERDKK